MKEEIVAKIVSVPLSEWKGKVLKINETEVVLRYSYAPMSPWIIIDGMEIYSPKITKLYWDLLDYQKKQEIELSNQKLISIYNKICIDHAL